MRRICILLSVILLGSCSSHQGPDRRTRSLLTELDGYLQSREMYVVRKKAKTAALSQLARNTPDPERRFDLEMTLADEFFPFSFDSAQTCLKHACQLAGNDALRSGEALVKLGLLYTKSGNYMEAYTLLYEQIDTTRLNEPLKLDYLLALYEFSRDMSGNSGMVERFSIPPEHEYREQLLRRLPPQSESWRCLLRDRLLDQGRLASADSVARILMSDLTQEDRTYAIHAYYRSEIAERSGKPDERLLWLVRSAECDIMNAVRDYAALTMVAQHILPVDVEHSFKYLRIAQEDALMYNAKLRPWQISRFLMDVEDAYSAKQRTIQTMVYYILGLLAILAIALSLITWFLVSRSRKLSRVRSELEKANTKLEVANITLNDLNRQISKADRVKEDYILYFLENMARQNAYFRSEDNRFRNLLKQGKADVLLKELSISSRDEKSREEFNETLDRTFLAIYPDFVEQFNALLQEDARLTPPKGRLNTELRIFALIRLGVDDSKSIASMLDYSVSTIYNYKVSIKNKALGDRNQFEQEVKKIGK